MLTAGIRVSPFELEAPEGGRMSVSTLIDSRPVVLAFFKVSCPVCQYTLPFLDRMDGVIGISQDDAAATRDFAEAFQIEFPLLLDPAGEGYKASNLFGITNVPSIFVIEPDLSISAAFSGFSRKDLEELGQRFGTPIFQPGERTPDFKPG